MAEDAEGEQDPKHHLGHRRRKVDEIDITDLRSAMTEMIAQIDAFVHYSVRFYVARGR